MTKREQKRQAQDQLGDGHGYMLTGGHAVCVENGVPVIYERQGWTHDWRKIMRIGDCRRVIGHLRKISRNGGAGNWYGRYMFRLAARALGWPRNGIVC